MERDTAPVRRTGRLVVKTWRRFREAERNGRAQWGRPSSLPVPAIRGVGKRRKNLKEIVVLVGWGFGSVKPDGRLAAVDWQRSRWVASTY